MSRFLYFLVLFMVMSAVLALAFDFKALVNPTRPYSSDLTQFLTGAWILRSQQGANLYDLPVQEKVQRQLIYPHLLKVDLLPFRSLPVVAAGFLPLTLVPLSVGYYAAFAGNLVLWLTAAFFLVKYHRRLSALGFWPLIFLGFLPLHQALQLSQLTPVILLILVFSYYLLEKSRFFAAGLLFSLMLIKPQFFAAGLVLMTLVSPRRRPFLTGALLGTGLILGICVLIAGPQAMLAYPGFVLATETASLGSHPKASLGLPPVWLAVVYPLFVILFIRTRRRFSLIYALLIVALVLPVFSLHVLASDTALLLLPVLILFGSGLPWMMNLAAVIYVLINLLFYISPRILSVALTILGFWLLFWGNNRNNLIMKARLS